MILVSSVPNRFISLAGNTALGVFMDILKLKRKISKSLKGLSDIDKIDKVKEYNNQYAKLIIKIVFSGSNYKIKIQPWAIYEPIGVRK